jgi:hypothetical protein
MTDFSPKGTGNSRFLKSSIGETTTWEQFRELLRGGTAPIDLNGINPLGINDAGTPLSKATLLTDATAANYGLPTTATPNDVFSAIKTLLDGKAKIETGAYTGTGTSGASNPTSLSFSGAPKILFIQETGQHGTPWLLFLTANLPTTYDTGNGFNYMVSGSTGNGEYFAKRVDKTVSWYCVSSADNQANHTGYPYKYIAITV